MLLEVLNVGMDVNFCMHQASSHPAVLRPHTVSFSQDGPGRTGPPGPTRCPGRTGPPALPVRTGAAPARSATPEWQPEGHVHSLKEANAATAAAAAAPGIAKVESHLVVSP
jgi:hypothetical protein